MCLVGHAADEGGDAFVAGAGKELGRRGLVRDLALGVDYRACCRGYHFTRR